MVDTDICLKLWVWEISVKLSLIYTQIIYRNFLSYFTKTNGLIS